MEKRVTLADVARRAGVSSASASLALNGVSARLAEDTRARVREAARELGYRPNIAAQSLRTDRTHTVAFVSDFVATTRFASRLIRGAMKAADERGMVLLVVETEGESTREERAVHTVLDRAVDGIIIAAMTAREVQIPDFPDSVHVVLLNATNPRYPQSILPDDFRGGETAVRLLTEVGHRRIALVGYDHATGIGGSPSLSLRRRLAGIDAQMARDGAEFVVQGGSEEWEPQEGYRIVRTQLEECVPDAFLCLNDRLAFGAYQAIQQRGLSIPDDVSVVSFDDDEIASYVLPGLTSIALPHEEMGRLALERLVTEQSPTEVLVPMPAVVRQSIGPRRITR
ncbi:LacI family DNA-binding transcriptional regulator [Humibacter soli]